MSGREAQKMRRSRNVALALVLLGLVVFVFVVSLTKMQLSVEQKRAMELGRSESTPLKGEGPKE